MKLRRPLGLVLAGGGAHGAWQAGVVSQWARERGLVFDHVMGFSIGCLTGAGYAFNRLDPLMHVFRNIDDYRILRLKPKLMPLSIFGNDSLREVLAYGGTEDEAKARARCRFSVIGYNSDDRRHEYFHYSPEGREGWDAPYSDHLMASCSIPVIFPPVKLGTHGRKRTFIDGGVGGDEGPSFGELHGCKDVIVLQMIRNDEFGRRAWGYWGRREQSNREGLYDYVTNAIRPLLGNGDDRRVFRFYPSRRLDFSMLSFNTAVCAPAVDLGQSDADVFLADPMRYRVE